jgi:hypothetical protein
MILSLALALALSALPAMAQQQPRSGAAQPFATSGGNFLRATGSFYAPGTRPAAPA